MEKVKEESKIYSNFNVIVEKADQDGYLTSIISSLNSILDKEVKYALKEIKKMKKMKIDYK